VFYRSDERDEAYKKTIGLSNYTLTSFKYDKTPLYHGEKL